MSHFLSFLSLWILFTGTLIGASNPNILLICTDGQGYGDVGVLNPDARVRTPNIDRIGNEGVIFTNAHSASSISTPARYAMMTGRYCWRTRLKEGVLKADDPCLIPDKRMTLGSFLKTAHYHTGFMGKWHLGMGIKGEFGKRHWREPILDMPLDKGFDYFYGLPAGLNETILGWFAGRHPVIPPSMFTSRKVNDMHPDYRIYPTYELAVADVAFEIDGPIIEVASDFKDNECLTRSTNKAIQWMGNHHKADIGKPFFLTLSYTAPKAPTCPLPRFYRQSDCGTYGDFLLEIDYHVGRLLEYLREAGVDRDTLIIFTSSHGSTGVEARKMAYGHDSNAGFRGESGNILEGAHRVPFLVRWPNGIAQPGRVSEHLVGHVDLLATFSEITSQSFPDSYGEDSVSFASVLKSVDKPKKRSPMIYHGDDGRFAIADGNWKFILPSRKKRAELYNIKKDPKEEQGLAFRRPEKVSELTRKINEIVMDGRSTPGLKQLNDTEYWDDLGWVSEKYYNDAIILKMKALREAKFGL